MAEPGVQGVRIGYERYGMQADLEHFQSRMEVDQEVFVIEEVAWVKEGLQSKDDRIARLRPDFEGGHFHLPYLCRNDDGKLCFLKVVAGEVQCVRIVTETSLMTRMKREGQLYRVLRPITRKDEEGRLYDVARRFITEYLSHPGLGSYKDLIDAVSRVYDMEPKPPVIVDEKETEPLVYEDS